MGQKWKIARRLDALRQPDERRPVARGWGGLRSPWLAIAILVTAALAAYSNSLHGEFILDDKTDIVGSNSISRLWPPWKVFVVRSEGHTALHSRPVVNLSLAINYAIAGYEPFGYHLTNLAIHVLAGLTLLGIVRRTLLLPRLEKRFTAASTPLALAVAMIWTLHPLQTESVTYVVQRYESMMGLFYLAALYAAIRCGTSARPRGWAVATVAAALLAMTSKEVAVSIPICILLYDRAFLAGSFREAWRRRRGLYLGLAGVWAGLAVLFLLSGACGTWAGYGLPFSWLEYAASQFGVILHYLRLSFWPSPLILDYKWPVARTAGQILPGLVVVGGLAVATIYGLVRRPMWGFLGAWFFLILAPTSSIMPLADLAFEHRMYLPLVAVVAGVVLGGFVAADWLARRGTVPLASKGTVPFSPTIAARRCPRKLGQSPLRTWQVTGGLLVILASLACGVLTFQRNTVYRTALSIWKDAVEKTPENERVHLNLGNALVAEKRLDEAIPEYRKAVAISPGYAAAHNNLGFALRGQGEVAEAIAEYRKALEIKPGFASATTIWPRLLPRMDSLTRPWSIAGRPSNSIPTRRMRNNLGVVLASRGERDEAIAQFRKALEISPDQAEGHANLASALLEKGEAAEAIVHFRKAVEVRPCAEWCYKFGNALALGGRIEEATVEYRKALEMKPEHIDARYNLGLALQRQSKAPEALAQWREAIRLQPDHVPSLNQLAWLSATGGEASVRNGAQAVEYAERAARLSGRDPNILDTLAAAYAEAGRFSEAVETAGQALSLAASQGNTTLAGAVRARMQLYETGFAYRDVQPPASAAK